MRLNTTVGWKELASFLLLFGLCGVMSDAVAGSKPDQADVAALGRAIEDLSKSYPEKYSCGKEFMDRLAKVADAKEFETLKRETLLANPALDFDKILLIKRSERNPGLPANWDSNCMLPRSGFDNEIAVFSPIDSTLTTLFRPTNDVFVGDVISISMPTACCSRCQRRMAAGMYGKSDPMGPVSGKSLRMKNKLITMTPATCPMVESSLHQPRLLPGCPV